MNKSEAIAVLESLGVAVVDGGRVRKEEFQKAFGARCKAPEWVVLKDYDERVKIPKEQIEDLEQKEFDHGRVVLPTSYIVGDFGQFVDGEGQEVSAQGLLYQYSLRNNPRNIGYAFRLYIGIKNVAHRSGISTLHSAKEECGAEAKKVIEENLFDID